MNIARYLEIEGPPYRPIVVLGADLSRAAFLAKLTEECDAEPILLGASLALRLMAASEQRTDVAEMILRSTQGVGPLILDRIEILFLPQLEIDVVDILTRIARRRIVCASWPGHVEGGRLRYAHPDHPEWFDTDVGRVHFLQTPLFESIGA